MFKFDDNLEDHLQGISYRQWNVSAHCSYDQFDKLPLTTTMNLIMACAFHLFFFLYFCIIIAIAAVLLLSLLSFTVNF